MEMQVKKIGSVMLPESFGFRNCPWCLAMAKAVQQAVCESQSSKSEVTSVRERHDYTEQCSSPGLVSIVVPAHNAESTLKRCIESLINQSYKKIEIIIVDDGSTDATREICDRLSESLQECRVVHQKNRGLSGARNTGLDNVKGEYVYFIDSDDYLAPDTIAQLVRSLENNRADMAVGGLTWVDSGGETVAVDCAENAVVSETEYWRAALGLTETKGKSVYIVSTGKLYKSCLFSSERFDEGKIHEDEYIIHRIVRQCNRVVLVSSAGYFYVKSTGTITSTVNTNALLDASEAILLRTDYFLARGWNILAWRSLSLACNSIAKSNSLPKTAGEVIRWEALCGQWKNHFSHLLHLPGKSLRSLVLCTAFRLSPGLFTAVQGWRFKRWR